MSTSKRRSDQASTGAERLQSDEAQATMNSGRDTRGRFARGNVGGPGNPFARRVAELRMVLVETVTDDELRIVAGQLMVKAKFGELAAIKLLFQYVLGKPAATVDPDTLDLDELDLYRRAPTPEQFREASNERLPADAVADVLRVKMPCVGAELKDRVARAVLGIGPDEEPLHDGDEEAQGTAPSTNGERDADPRRTRTRPSPNGGFPNVEARRLPAGNNDNQRRPSGTQNGERRPPHGS
jgi:hypothetical protein